MTSKRDYYEVLGLERTATDQEIKRAYRRLAMDHHPDRNPGNREAEERFKEAAEAYQVLSDLEKRKRYDQFGHAGMGSSSGFHPNGFSGFSDIFSAFADIFGGGSTEAVGEDIQLSLKLTFLEAVQGCKREVTVEQRIHCTTCQGSGAKPGTRPVVCRACQGRGQVIHRQGFFSIATDCPECKGQGSTIAEPCPTCRGKTYTTVPRQVTVQVPAGVDEGTRLRMSGLGHAAPTAEGTAGDLYIVFHVAPDPRFTREGNNLYMDVPLTITQAALGAKIPIETLEGTETIEILPGTQPMQERVLSGRGVPHLRARGRGDFIIRFVVHIPKKPSPEVHALLTQLHSHLDPIDTSLHVEKESTFQRLFRRKKSTS